MAEGSQARVRGGLTAGPRRMRHSGMILLGVLLTLLHQDFWLWDNRALILGFLPTGLAYHMIYSLVAAGFWAACIRWAWPARWEEWADPLPEEDQ